MQNTLEGCTERHRQEALQELIEELREFSYDGLVLLEQDLTQGQVLRGSWGGCVLSYKRGHPGSTRRDRRGRARNLFTVLWDDGALTDEEVIAAVLREMASRRARRSAAPDVGSPEPLQSPELLLGGGA